MHPIHTTNNSGYHGAYGYGEHVLSIYNTQLFSIASTYAIPIVRRACIVHYSNMLIILRYEKYRYSALYHITTSTVGFQHTFSKAMTGSGNIHCHTRYSRSNVQASTLDRYTHTHIRSATCILHWLQKH